MRDCDCGTPKHGIFSNSHHFEGTPLWVSGVLRAGGGCLWAVFGSTNDGTLFITFRMYFICHIDTLLVYFLILLFLLQFNIYYHIILFLFSTIFSHSNSVFDYFIFIFFFFCCVFWYFLYICYMIRWYSDCVHTGFSFVYAAKNLSCILR